MQTATFTVDHQWNNGFTASLSLKNQAQSTIQGWLFELEAPFTIDKVWNAQLVSRSGNRYRFRNLSYNKTIAGDSAVSFGFRAKAPSGAIAPPTNFRLNGLALEAPPGPATAQPRPSSPQTSPSLTIPPMAAPATAPAEPGVAGPTPSPSDRPVAQTLGQALGQSLAQTSGQTLAPLSTAQFKVTQDWRSGFTGSLSLTNTSGQSLDNWRFEFQAPFPIRNLWGGELVSRQGDRYSVSAPRWNRTLSPGERVTIGFNVDRPAADSGRPSGYRLGGDGALNLAFGDRPPAPTSPGVAALQPAVPRPTPQPQPAPSPIAPPRPSQPTSPLPGRSLWSDGFEQDSWQNNWGKTSGRWGQANLSRVSDSRDRNNDLLRVTFPAGSSSPAYARSANRPLGGGEFKADLGLAPADALRLSYKIRFSDNFNFVQGGKLPGLYGGKGNSGGNIPNGSDGFSTRLMWRSGGRGEVNAYLPTSRSWGTPLGTGNWRFEPGTWHGITQEVVLNDPGRANGKVTVWFDGDRVLHQEGLTFRKTQQLKIDGIFFSSFFGGNGASWATPKTVYADFDDFQVSAPTGQAPAVQAPAVQARQLGHDPLLGNSLGVGRAGSQDILMPGQGDRPSATDAGTTILGSAPSGPAQIAIGGADLPPQSLAGEDLPRSLGALSGQGLAEPSAAWEADPLALGGAAQSPLGAGAIRLA